MRSRCSAAGRGSPRPSSPNGCSTCAGLPRGPAAWPWSLALVVATVVSATVSTVRYDHYWRPNPARPYLQTLRVSSRPPTAGSPSSTTRFRSRSNGACSTRTRCLSHTLSPLRQHPTFLRAGHPSATLAVVDATGHLRRPEIRGVANQPGPVPNCGYRLHHSSVTVALRSAALKGTWVLRMGYLSGGSADLQLTAGDATQTVPVTKGLNSALPGGARRHRPRSDRLDQPRRVRVHRRHHPWFPLSRSQFERAMTASSGASAHGCDGGTGNRPTGSPGFSRAGRHPRPGHPVRPRRARRVLDGPLRPRLVTRGDRSTRDRGDVLLRALRLPAVPALAARRGPGPNRPEPARLLLAARSADPARVLVRGAAGVRDRVA